MYLFLEVTSEARQRTFSRCLFHSSSIHSSKMSDGDQSTAAPADGKKRKIEDDDGPASTTQTTKSERYYDPAADLVIISSDNVEFRIHPYLMQTHS